MNNIASIQQALILAIRQLEVQQQRDARFEAELLLAYLLQKPRVYLHTWPERLLDPITVQRYDAVVKRRMAGEPIAYITGTKEFWSLELEVTAATLIPRPETERLVELVVERVPVTGRYCIADLGTGSGAIALAIATERPECRVIATDLSREALAVARRNAARHQIHNIEFRESRWLSALAGEKLHLIAANPPYIAPGDSHLTEGDLRFEPNSALVAGEEGMADLNHIARHAREYLFSGGWLVMEHGYDQRDKVSNLLTTLGYVNIQDHCDNAGQPRIVVGQFL